jgi:hypothetical protein
LVNLSQMLLLTMSRKISQMIVSDFNPHDRHKITNVPIQDHIHKSKSNQTYIFGRLKITISVMLKRHHWTHWYTGACNRQVVKTDCFIHAHSMHLKYLNHYVHYFFRLCQIC